MSRNFLYILSYLMVMLIFTSCIPKKKLNYIRDNVTDEISYPIPEKEIQRIKPNDQLYIRVSSFDDISYNFFSTQTDVRNLGYGSEISLSLVSYNVDDSGCIYFPILGKIYLKDLTIDEATTKMKKMLSEYFNQPTVLIKYVNKKISILGEVNHPGHYTFTNDRINIFEALSMAGDISVTGNRKSVILLREENGKNIKKSIDLTNDDIFNSNHYYLKSNDILYIRPIGATTWRTISVPISLTLTTIATFILLFNSFNTTN